MLDKRSLNISNRSSKYGNGDSIKIYLSLSLSPSPPLFDFEKRISSKREEGRARLARSNLSIVCLLFSIEETRGWKEERKGRAFIIDRGTARKYFHKREKGRSERQTEARGLARNDGPIFVISVHAVNFRRRESGSRVITLRSTNFRSLAESIRVRLPPTNRHR